jgi:hypothetical protein
MRRVSVGHGAIDGPRGDGQRNVSKVQRSEARTRVSSPDISNHRLSPVFVDLLLISFVQWQNEC